MGSKRKKSYYSNSSKRYKGAELQQGSVGFLFSFVRDRERQAKAEAYELLNSYATDVFGKEQAQQDTSSDEAGSDGDIEAAMERQVAKLKEKKAQRGDRFSFQDTGVNQILFMKTTLENHNLLTYKILEDAKKGDLKCKSRVLHRMVPVLATCRAEPDKIGECAIKAINTYLKDNVPDNPTYKSLVKVRNNNNKDISQTQLIKVIGEVMREHHTGWKVNLTDPTVTIVVDVLKMVACVSVIHGYLAYKKFNLQELVVSHHTSQTISAGSTRVKAVGIEDASTEHTGGESTEALTDGRESTSALTDGRESTSALTDGRESTSALTDGRESTSALTDGREITSALTDGRESTSALTDGRESTSALTERGESTSALTDGRESTSAPTERGESAQIETECSDTLSIATNITDNDGGEPSAIVTDSGTVT